MGLVVTALSVARERELGTFEQLLVSPLSPREIIIGKTLPALLVGLAEATAMVAGGSVRAARAVHRLDCCCCIRRTVVYLFAVIGVGLFVSSLAKTQQQAILGTFMFMVPVDDAVGLCQPDRKHARVAANRDPGQSDPLLHRDRQGGLPEGPARADGAAICSGRWRSSGW